MEKFSGILLCTDLDGTVLDSNKNVSKENLDAIEYFKSEGGLYIYNGKNAYDIKENLRYA